MIAGNSQTLFLFIAVAGLTPGPNNIIAMSIGFNHGFGKVLPHLFGVLVGFPVMLILIGLVLLPVMQKHEDLYLFLKYISIAYVIYLSYRIASAPADTDMIPKSTKPAVGFWQSVAFQWVNPKAWAGALTTVTVYVSPDHFASNLTVAVLLSILSIFVAIPLWALLGREIGRWLRYPVQVRVFNVVMALLLLSAVGMMVL